MPSTVIARFTYAAQPQHLDVQFRGSGRWYRYFEVPPQVHDAFRAAFSKGQFFNTEIRDRYRFRQLRSGEVAGREPAGLDLP